MLVDHGHRPGGRDTKILPNSRLLSPCCSKHRPCWRNRCRKSRHAHA